MIAGDTNPPGGRKLPRERQKVSVFTIVITVLLFLPLVVIVLASFNPDPYLLFPPAGFSLDWFVAALQYPNFRQSLALSVQVALIVAVIGLLITLPAAVAVTRGSGPVRRAVQFAMAAPLVTPELLLALGLLIMFSRLSVSSSLVGLVLGHTLVGLPIALQVLVAGMAGLNPDLEQAAATLGAARMRAFFHVTLPSMLPGIASAALFLFILSFDNVSISLFLAAPGQSTLPITLFNYIENNADPMSAAMSTILVVIGVAVALLLGRLGGLGQLTGVTGKTR